MITVPIGFNAKPAVAGNSATFLGADTTTKGSWIGTYGADGYWIERNFNQNDTSVQSLPGYVSLCSWYAVAGYDWNDQVPPTTLSALQNPADPTGNRWAVTWYANVPVSTKLQLTLTSLKTMRIYAYAYDGGRSHSYLVRDRDSNAILIPSRTIAEADLTAGVWHSFSMRGNLDIEFTYVYGINVTAASGIFFDA